MSENMEVPSAERLLAFFKLLSDTDRLKIAGLLAIGPHSIEQMAATASIAPADAAHHVMRLMASGFVAEVEGGVYRFQAKRLEEMAHDILRRTKASSPVLEGADAFECKVVSDFCDAAGRLKRLPAQRKKLIAVLRYVDKVFQPGVRYSEKQVNELLSRFHEDTAALRRALVDHRFTARQAGIYWQVQERSE